MGTTGDGTSSRSADGRRAASGLEDLEPPATLADVDPFVDPADPAVDPPVTLGHGVSAAFAIAFGMLAAALPIAALAWLVLTHLGLLVLAEVLEQSGGLEATTFGASYWLGTLVDGIIVLWCVVRRVRGRPRPFRPLYHLCLAYALMLWSVVPADLLGGGDTLDVPVAATLLGAFWLIRYIMPCALLLVCLNGAAHMWRSSQKSLRSGRRVSAMSVGFGLVGFSLFGALLIAAGADYTSFEDSEVSSNDGGGGIASLSLGGVNQDRDYLAELAESIERSGSESSGSTALTTTREPFQQCAETLYQSRRSSSGSRTARSRPVVSIAITDLVRRHRLDHADAEDLAMATLVKVCLRHAREPVSDLSNYFWAALGNERRQRYREQRRLVPPIDDWEVPDEGVSLGERLIRDEDLRAARRALQRLDPKSKLIIEMRYLQERSHADIAASLSISEAAARKRLQRAMDQLRRAYRAERGD